MSTFRPLLNDTAARARCDGCGEEFPAIAAGMIESAEQRLTAGEEVPVGECPACGGCSFLVQETQGLPNEPDLWAHMEKLSDLIERLRGSYLESDVDEAAEELEKWKLAVHMCIVIRRP